MPVCLCNWTVCTIAQAYLNGLFFSTSNKKTLGISCVFILKKAKTSQILL